MKINFVSEFLPLKITRFTLIGLQFNTIVEEDRSLSFDYSLSINMWLFGFGLQILIK